MFFAAFTNSSAILTAAVGILSLVGLIVSAFGLSRTPVELRVDDLGERRGSRKRGATEGRSPLDQRTDRWIEKDERKERLRERLVQAGLYSGGAFKTFSVIRVAMICGPVLLGIILSAMNMIPTKHAIGIGLILGIAGTLAPSFWLDRIKRKRQTTLRRALPDALDIIVVCVQGGLSLNAAIGRVARELVVAHPLLALELNIVERQTQMGRSTGDALREMGQRFDLEELRSMASAVKQAERIGASIATAMEVFGESLRLKRSQRAESMAHKATVKIMFPTLLCILPAIFVVILGPAYIQIQKAFE